MQAVGGWPVSWVKPRGGPSSAALLSNRECAHLLLPCPCLLQSLLRHSELRRNFLRAVDQVRVSVEGNDLCAATRY